MEAGMEYLDPSHPSYGCKKAVFTYLLTKSNRCILVEATNPYAVACLERFSIYDQKVSDSCVLLSVIRDYSTVGTRNASIVEVKFVDFILDFVDKRILNTDIFGFTCFSKALSLEDRKYARAKIQAQKNKFLDVDDTVLAERPNPVIAEITRSPVIPDDNARKILISLGFPKKEVEAWANKFDANGLEINEIIRRGCQMIGRAAA